VGELEGKADSRPEEKVGIRMVPGLETGDTLYQRLPVWANLPFLPFYPQKKAIAAN
jgi:hypothetical protein